MALVSLITAALVVSGSGLVVPPAQDRGEPVDPPPGFPITDPGYEPLYIGLGHEPDVQEAFDSPTVLFVNFDGPFMNAGCGNSSQQDCSTIFPNTQFSPSPADAATRAAVVQATREDVVDFGVIVVGERPPEGNPYAMVVVGTPAGGGPAGVGGVAPGIDCGNNNPNITSFSFLVNSSANIQATVIHQEAAHTWGLEHVDDPTDNLFPSVGGINDPKYQDVCSQVVSDTMLNPTGSGCNSVHTLFCDPNNQNSYREMLQIFGPPVPDQIAPSVVIEAPTEGQIFEYEDDFDLTITLDDDRRPQVLDTLIFFDETEAASTSLINATLTFPVGGGDPPGGHGLSNGLHTIRVEITDEAGNPAMAEVTIEIAGSPFGNADETGADDTMGDASGTEGLPGGTMGGGSSAGPFVDGTGDEGCGCRSYSSGMGSGAWMLMLLAAGTGMIRRRRSAVPLG